MLSSVTCACVMPCSLSSPILIYPDTAFGALQVMSLNNSIQSKDNVNRHLFCMSKVMAIISLNDGNSVTFI